MTFLEQVEELVCPGEVCLLLDISPARIAASRLCLDPIWKFRYDEADDYKEITGWADRLRNEAFGGFKLTREQFAAVLSDSDVGPGSRRASMRDVLQQIEVAVTQLTQELCDRVTAVVPLGPAAANEQVHECLTQVFSSMRVVHGHPELSLPVKDDLEMQLHAQDAALDADYGIIVAEADKDGLYYDLHTLYTRGQNPCAQDDVPIKFELPAPLNAESVCVAFARAAPQAKLHDVQRFRVLEAHRVQPANGVIYGEARWKDGAPKPRIGVAQRLKNFVSWDPRNTPLPQFKVSPPEAELHFVLDGTLSLWHLDIATQIITEAVTTLLGKNVPARYGLSVYADFPSPDAYGPYEEPPQEDLSDPSELNDGSTFLTRLVEVQPVARWEPRGSLEHALESVAGHQWSGDYRAVIVVGNAPPHRWAGSVGTYGEAIMSPVNWHEQLTRLKDQGVQLLTAVLPLPEDSWPPKLTKEIKDAWQAIKLPGGFQTMRDPHALVQVLVNRVTQTRRPPALAGVPPVPLARPYEELVAAWVAAQRQP